MGIVQFLAPVFAFARATFPWFCALMILIFLFDLFVRFFLAPRVGKGRKSSKTSSRRRSSISTHKGR